MFPNAIRIEKQCVPEQFRTRLTFVEWLHIVSQLEQTFCRLIGMCTGPDPYLGPGLALAETFNAAYSSVRGVGFTFNSRPWHPDRVGQQFHREFIIDVVGASCILTHETTVQIKIPEGVRAGKVFIVSVLDGQAIPTTCPKGSGAGDTLPLTFASPVLVEQLLNISVPDGAAGGQTVLTALCGGCMTAVQLPGETAPGQVVQIRANCVQLIPAQEVQG